MCKSCRASKILRIIVQKNQINYYNSTYSYLQKIGFGTAESNQSIALVKFYLITVSAYLEHRRPCAPSDAAASSAETRRTPRLPCASSAYRARASRRFEVWSPSTTFCWWAAQGAAPRRRSRIDVLLFRRWSSFASVASGRGWGKRGKHSMSNRKEGSQMLQVSK